MHAVHWCLQAVEWSVLSDELLLALAAVSVSSESERLPVCLELELEEGTLGGPWAMQCVECVECVGCGRSGASLG
jgi:hypothetical protein